jgi:hypothetical protein
MATCGLSGEGTGGWVEEGVNGLRGWEAGESVRGATPREGEGVRILVRVSAAERMFAAHVRLGGGRGGEKGGSNLRAQGNHHPPPAHGRRPARLRRAGMQKLRPQIGD